MSQIRTYNVAVEFPQTEKKSIECQERIKKSQYLSRKLKEVIEFIKNPVDKEFCSFQMQVSCYSCGKQSINNFRKILLTNYPNAVFVEFARQR